METKTIETGDRPHVMIETIGGDLRLAGRERAIVEAKALGRGKLAVEGDRDQVRVSCQSDCLLFVPIGSRLEVESVGGDARVTDVSEDILIRTVGGDLSLRHVGGSAIELIGGDLSVNRVEGSLTIDKIGGDAAVKHVAGDLRLRGVGGDLILEHVDGLVEVAAGGDAVVEFTPSSGAPSSVRAGGDVVCQLPEGVSVSVGLRAGGDLILSPRLETEATSDGVVLKLGAAEATLELAAGGDLALTVGSRHQESVLDLGAAIASRVGAEIEAEMAGIEGQLSGLDPEIWAFDPNRLNRQIRRAVTRARRKATKAWKRAARRTVPSEPGLGRLGLGELGFGAKGAEPVTEEERLVVLRMLEEGKLSVEEAEKLLGALEGDTG